MFGIYDKDKNKVTSQQLVDNAASAAHPQILNLNGTLINAWKRFNGEQTQILARHSFNNGKSWSELEILKNTNEASDHPLLISYNNTAYLSWHTEREGYTLTPIDLQ